jgi:hypothetical protein
MRYHLFLGLIWILVLTLGLQAGNIQAGEALVCTDPVRLEVGAGQIGTLKIMLVNAKAIYGIDLQATFDPTVVEVVDADAKKTGVQMMSGIFLKPDFLVRNVADNKTGTLRYVVTQLNPTPPASGKGVVLSVQFRGKASGTSSKLTITSAVITDRRGVKQPVTTRGAELIIVPRKSSTPTALPALTLIPAIPTWSAATFTQARSQPAAQPSATAAQNNPAARSSEPAAKNNPATRSSETAVQDDAVRVAGRNSASSDQVLTYIIIGGFSGAILLTGLSVWLLVAKRSRDKATRPK